MQTETTTNGRTGNIGQGSGSIGSSGMRSSNVGRKRSEDEITQGLEEFSTEVPSGAFLGFAVGSMLVSAALQVAGKRQLSNFIGQWVPSILIMGVYNKIVKLHGSEPA